MNELYDHTSWTRFDILWPWIGLAAACFIFLKLFTGDTLRHNPLISRWRDPVWLSWLSIPIYMLHQFEEYGVDLMGRTHSFPDSLCSALGQGNYPSCSIPHEFFLFVNISLVWLFAVVGAKFCRRHPFIGLGLYSVMIVNAAVHIISAIIRQSYNPGLLSAVVLFLPAFFWMCRVCFGRERVRKIWIGVWIISGTITHVILVISLLLFLRQKINAMILDVIQIINAATILVIPGIAEKVLEVFRKKRWLLFKADFKK